MKKAKLIALVSALSLIIPLVFASATNAGAESTSLIYTAIGDSIAAGYRLPAYTGDGKNTKGAYVALLGEELGATKINDKAISGSDTSDTLSLLNNSAYAASVAEADVITVSMGSNDLLGPGQQIIMEALGITSMSQLGASLAPDAIGGLKKISEYAKKDEQKARLSSAVESFKVNWVAMIDKIVELNPDAVIVVSNYYNPYFPLSALASYGVDIDKTVDTYLGQMNEFITSHRYSGKLYWVADVTEVGVNKTNVNLISAEMDPHPNADGHTYIYEKMLATYKTAIAKPNLPMPEQTTTLPFVTTDIPCETAEPQTTTTVSSVTTTSPYVTTTLATSQSSPDETSEEKQTDTARITAPENNNSSCAGSVCGVGFAVLIVALASTAVIVIKKKG